MYWCFSVFLAEMLYISDSVIQNNLYFRQKNSPFNKGKYWIEHWLIKSFERSKNIWIPTICINSNLIVYILSSIYWLSYLKNNTFNIWFYKNNTYNILFYKNCVLTFITVYFISKLFLFFCYFKFTFV